MKRYPYTDPVEIMILFAGVAVIIAVILSKTDEEKVFECKFERHSELVRVTEDELDEDRNIVIVDHKGRTIGLPRAQLDYCVPLEYTDD